VPGRHSHALAYHQQIWEHARVHGFVIVSKDTDFRERSYLEVSAKGGLA
jgi:predicted nuclease of predicted toxin-antitoxin system